MSRRKASKPTCSSALRRAKRIKDPRKRKAALKAAKRCKTAAETKAPSAKQAPAAVQAAPLPQGTQPVAALVAPVASGAAAPAVPEPAPVAAPAAVSAAAAGLVDSPIAKYTGAFGRRQAERLLWRAGFGPRPGQAATVAAMGLEAAVTMLTRPSGAAPMVGPAPSLGGKPLDPLATFGHDHLWWLDRMVRSEHQLVERMALIWHDWFAVNSDGVGSTPHMLQQNNLFRAQSLGGFDDLLRAITTDPAMLVFLSGINNRKNMPNENYAREVMELFTLGADRGAYTEADVRELARALSGWRGEFVRGTGWINFRYDPVNSWDPGIKTVFGKSGAFTWEDACRLVVEHPKHASFFVRKLWSAFIPKPPDATTAAALERRYVESGRQIRPVVEAILCSPQFYEGPWMVKPPVVFAAGLLRATNQGVDQAAYEWGCTGAGQRLFFPPDVSGWDESRWMNTGSLRGRWDLVNYTLAAKSITSATWNTHPVQTAAEAVAAARAFWNDPPLRSETIQSLTTWAGTAIGASVKPALHAQRQNALRLLIGTSSDHATC